jgi:hypothetical protein
MAANALTGHASISNVRNSAKCYTRTPKCQAAWTENLTSNQVNTQTVQIYIKEKLASLLSRHISRCMLTTVTILAAATKAGCPGLQFIELNRSPGHLRKYIELNWSPPHRRTDQWRWLYSGYILLGILHVFGVFF